jgi:hypothetical protein
VKEFTQSIRTADFIKYTVQSRVVRVDGAMRSLEGFFTRLPFVTTTAAIAGDFVLEKADAFLCHQEQCIAVTTGPI